MQFLFLDSICTQYEHESANTISYDSMLKVIKEHRILKLSLLNLLIYLGFNIFYVSIAIVLTNPPIYGTVLILPLYYGIPNLLMITFQIVVLKLIVDKYSRYKYTSFCYIWTLSVLREFFCHFPSTN